MLIGLRNSILGKRLKYTARDYVQNGLVAMWDGIENAGWGVHDPNATMWKDLISGWDGTLGTNTSWSANSMVVSGDGFPCTVPVDVGTVMNTLNWTVEFVFTPTNINRRAVLFGQHDGSGFNIENIWGNGVNNSIRFYFNGYPDIRLESPVFTANTPLSITSTSTADVFYAYKNATEILTYTQSRSAPKVSSFVLGGEQSRANMSARGYHHCYRLYSRALTADEIARNYAIDKARFNLP